MEHPPKQGLKHREIHCNPRQIVRVLMEHPPKQGLKPRKYHKKEGMLWGFNGTSTKTRIETPCVHDSSFV